MFLSLSLLILHLGNGPMDALFDCPQAIHSRPAVNRNFPHFLGVLLPLGAVIHRVPNYTTRPAFHLQNDTVIVTHEK
jgi:hypothetical protein